MIMIFQFQKAAREILLFLFLSLITLSGFSQESSRWEKSFDEAKIIAEQQDKPILIYFTGSDWCNPCKLLVIDFFDTEQFQALADDSLVLYEADFPRHENGLSKSQRKINNRLLNRYNVTTFPTLVIINERGKRLGHIAGYSRARGTQYHYNLLKRVINP
jgi:thioredoxin-related protein